MKISLSFLLSLFCFSGVGQAVEERTTAQRAPTASELKKPRDAISIWDELSDLKDLKKAEKSKREKELYKDPVEIGGYIIANEFGDAKITEFLLTQIPGGCVHVPLPPPEKMIHVQMNKDKSSAVFFGKRVIVKGKLGRGERVDSSFELQGDEVKEFPLK